LGEREAATADVDRGQFPGHGGGCYQQCSRLQSAGRGGIIAAVNPMAAPTTNANITISQRDILFECPACRKSLVIDEAAEGMIVECPKCRAQVIVPPKETGPAPTAAPTPAVMPQVTAPAPAPVAPGPLPAELPARLNALANQLKELQTQRVEIATTVAARLNEINRQMVLLSRLEASHKQVLADWNQALQQLKGAAPGKQTQVNF
jgi:predicted RNA-binding Zn-ribbon protein involved in translation (DUF1610 family)